MQRMSPLRDPAKAVLHNPDLHLPVPDRGRCSSYFKVIFSGQIDLAFSLALSCPKKTSDSDSARSEFRFVCHLELIGYESPV